MSFVRRLGSWRGTEHRSHSRHSSIRVGFPLRRHTLLGFANRNPEQPPEASLVRVRGQAEHEWSIRWDPIDLPTGIHGNCVSVETELHNAVLWVEPYGHAGHWILFHHLCSASGMSQQLMDLRSRITEPNRVLPRAARTRTKGQIIVTVARACRKEREDSHKRSRISQPHASSQE